MKPLKFSRDLNDFYAGQHLFLLCGGPSLRAVDPRAFDQPGVLTMAINNAARVIRPNLWIGGDTADHFIASIFRDGRIIKFVPENRAGDQLFDSSKWQWTPWNVKGSPGVVFFPNRAGYEAEKFLLEGVVRWGDEVSRRSIVAAIRIAAALGLVRIVLVGCDWHMSPEDPYAFDEVRKPSLAAKNNEHFATWSERFQVLRPILERAGVEIRNATPGSRLEAFDSIDLAEAIEQARTAMSIDVGRERTRGMYDAKPPKPKIEHAPPATTNPAPSPTQHIGPRFEWVQIGDAPTAASLLQAVNRATGDVICFSSPTAWYATSYVETTLRRLEKSELVGEGATPTYNASLPGYRRPGRTTHAPWAATAGRRDAILRSLRGVADQHAQIDPVTFWRAFGGRKAIYRTDPPPVVILEHASGSHAGGAEHAGFDGYTLDAGTERLVSWLGGAAACYLRDRFHS